jgi:hypothetical protein
MTTIEEQMAQLYVRGHMRDQIGRKWGKMSPVLERHCREWEWNGSMTHWGSWRRFEGCGSQAWGQLIQQTYADDYFSHSHRWALEKVQGISDCRH